MMKIIQKKHYICWVNLKPMRTIEEIIKDITELVLSSNDVKKLIELQMELASAKTKQPTESSKIPTPDWV